MAEEFQIRYLKSKLPALLDHYKDARTITIGLNFGKSKRDPDQRPAANVM